MGLVKSHNLDLMVGTEIYSVQVFSVVKNDYVDDDDGVVAVVDEIDDVEEEEDHVVKPAQTVEHIVVEVYDQVLEARVLEVQAEEE